MFLRLTRFPSMNAFFLVASELQNPPVCAIASDGFIEYYLILVLRLTTVGMLSIYLSSSLAPRHLECPVNGEARM